jgi:hypothetical protein
MKKIKVVSIDTIVNMKGGKPYYENKYREVGDKCYHIGYSSYSLETALEYKDEFFELVEIESDLVPFNVKYKVVFEIFKQDIELGLYDKSLVAVAMQIGRLSAFLELSDFTEDEKDNEENKLRELCNCWEKRYYSKEEK